MKTVNDLLTATAAFLGRDRSVFVKNGFDCLLQAANNARLYAERAIDFELSRVSVKVPNVSITDGGSLANAVLLSDGVTSVSVKKITKAFVKYPGSTDACPIAFYSRQKWLNRVQRKIEKLTPLDVTLYMPAPVNWTNEAIIGAIRQFSVIQSGNQVFLVPSDPTTFQANTTDLYFDVLRWLPSYGSTVLTGLATSTSSGKLVCNTVNFITSGVRIGNEVRNGTDGTSALVTSVEGVNTLTLSGDIFTSGEGFTLNIASENDFLLDSCFDWLMYRSVYELNFFLKEDDRVQISTNLISDAWNAMRSWNENLISQSVDDADLS